MRCHGEPARRGDPSARRRSLSELCEHALLAWQSRRRPRTCTPWTICCAGLKRPSACRRRWCSGSIGRPAFSSEAMGLRETIFRCFAATASGGAPAEDDLAALNAALAAAPARQHVRHGGWDIGTPDPSAVTLLAPTLWSAADLLVGNQLARVRQCANPAVWLAVPRQQQERQPPLVFDERLRQSRQGAPALSAAEERVGRPSR